MKIEPVKNYILREHMFAKNGKTYKYTEYSPTEYFDKRIEISDTDGKLIKSKEYHGSNQLGESFSRILKTDNLNDTSVSRIFQRLGGEKHLDEICHCKNTDILISDVKQGSEGLSYNFKKIKPRSSKIHEFCQNFGKIGKDVLKIASKRPHI